MPKQVIGEMERRMKAAMHDLAHDLGTLRTGRATPALLDKVTVDYHGSVMPLAQLATITAPEGSHACMQFLSQVQDPTGRGHGHELRRRSRGGGCVVIGVNVYRLVHIHAI